MSLTPTDRRDVNINRKRLLRTIQNILVFLHWCYIHGEALKQSLIFQDKTIAHFHFTLLTFAIFAISEHVFYLSRDS